MDYDSDFDSKPSYFQTWQGCAERVNKMDIIWLEDAENNEWDANDIKNLELKDKRIAELEAKLKIAVEFVEYFKNRCETGSIRSVVAYDKAKEALEQIDDI